MDDISRKVGIEILDWRDLNETLLRYMKGEENLIGKLIDGSLPSRDLDLLLDSKSKEERISPFQERISQVYATQIRQGYEFKTNCDITSIFPDCDLSSLVKKYMAEGFDVFVGDRAFGRDGNEYPSMKAIFIKRIGNIQ